MKLATPAAAARRFAPYALMSALTYANDVTDECPHKSMLEDDEKRRLESLLRQATSEEGSSSWESVRIEESGGRCENKHGFAFRVWQNKGDVDVIVVVAFRGTSDSRDWRYGNLHWLNRLVGIDDQFTDAWTVTPRIVHKLKERNPGRRIRFIATGHSLGGGLAQGALYALPDDFDQAIVFDPSSVTGFADQAAAGRVARSPRARSRPHEARIYRVYESSEVLSWLRTPHKLFWGLPPWVNEVRFSFDGASAIGQHSIRTLASNLETLASTAQPDASPWNAPIGAACANQMVQVQHRYGGEQ